jgi:hypothetical protein
MRRAEKFTGAENIAVKREGRFRQRGKDAKSAQMLPRCENSLQFHLCASASLRGTFSAFMADAIDGDQ